MVSVCEGCVGQCGLFRAALCDPQAAEPGGDVYPLYRDYTHGDRPPPGAIAPSAGGGPAPAARQPPGAPLTTLLVGDRALGASEAAPPGPAGRSPAAPVVLVGGARGTSGFLNLSGATCYLNSTLQVPPPWLRARVWGHDTGCF